MVTVNSKTNVVTIKIVGKQCFSQLREMIREQLNHPGYREGMGEIWDLRDANMAHASGDDLRAHACFVKKTFPSVNKRIAFVVKDKLHYGLVRMWMTHAEINGAEQERELFDCIGKAKDWLLKEV